MNTLNSPFLLAVHILFDLGTIGDRTDGELMHWFTTGDGETAEFAFMAIVGRHGPMVLRVCQGILRDPHEAEDAFQAVFPQIVLYGTGRWVYASSTETNTWDALEIAGDEEVRARVSGANVLVEDVHNNKLSIFAPAVGRWDTIDTGARSE